mmetsp:Transcript_10558/g.18595  ORF Transcript_10558/g.18595 Transcript_10558/m.18595 type:complete len:499 (+) Transcript_10558:80-1576(+)
MFASKRLEEQDAVADLYFCELYPWLIEEYKEGLKATKFGRHYWDNIWSSKAPRSNIYRYNGLCHMHRLITYDLRQQLEELADQYAHIFTQYTSNRMERAQILVEVLRKVQVENSPEVLAKGETPLEGFLPLTEFLESPVTEWLPGFAWATHGPILVPTDPQERKLFWENGVMACAVFCLQITAPFCMIINHWVEGTNYVKDPRLAWNLFSWQEVKCLGGSQVPMTMTIVGTLLLIIVIFIVRVEVNCELQDTKKLSKALNSSWWFFIGTFANAWSCCFVSFALPLLFWSLTDVVTLICDSMGVLFIYGLDDIVSDVFRYLNSSDESYARSVAWTSIFLTKCPLNIKDVVNPQARSVNEFWRIRFDSEGHLLNVSNQRCVVRLDEFSFATASDRDPLIGSGEGRTPRCVYRDRHHEKTLPNITNRLGSWMWSSLALILWIAQFVVPMVWFVFNDACDPKGLLMHFDLRQVGASAWNHSSLQETSALVWNHTATWMHIKQ